jgi:hypothetical protein
LLVFRGIGRTQNHNRDLTAHGAYSHTLQHLPPARLRQIQVQDDELRAGETASVNLFNEVQGLLPVAKDKKFAGNPVLSEHMTNQSDVPGIILH